MIPKGFGLSGDLKQGGDGIPIADCRKAEFSQAIYLEETAAPEQDPRVEVLRGARIGEQRRRQISVVRPVQAAP